MIIAKLFKAPQDRKRITVDYTNWLDSDELITSATATTPNLDGFYVDGIVVGSSNKEIIFFVSGGAEDGVYLITISVYTSSTQIKVDTAQFTCNSEGRNL